MLAIPDNKIPFAFSLSGGKSCYPFFSNHYTKTAILWEDSYDALNKNSKGGPIPPL